MIELQNIRFTYSEGGFGLHVERLCLAEGQRACWIGPSGSGKTTLLHLVAGIFCPDSGQMKIGDVDVTSLGDAARRDFRITKVGLVFQDFALLDYLSVMDNILLPYRISSALRLEAAVFERARGIANSLGLTKRLSRKPTALSQGERQRVAVCRAIVTEPELLLADEPTANLDAQNAARVLDALDAYASERTANLIVVSHDRDTIARFGKTTDVSEFCTQAAIDRVGGESDA